MNQFITVIYISSKARKATLASCRDMCHQAFSAGAARFLHSPTHPVSYHMFHFAQIQPVEMTLQMIPFFLTIVFLSENDGLRTYHWQLKSITFNRYSWKKSLEFQWSRNFQHPDQSEKIFISRVPKWRLISTLQMEREKEIFPGYLNQLEPHPGVQTLRTGCRESG